MMGIDLCADVRPILPTASLHYGNAHLVFDKQLLFWLMPQEGTDTLLVASTHCQHEGGLANLEREGPNRYYNFVTSYVPAVRAVIAPDA
eukprot:1161342-Pelagomonas_calceolata.AAC.4